MTERSHSQEFLIIGITSAVRHGLELAAAGNGTNQQEVVMNLTINAIAVFILVVALWLIRQHSKTL